VTAKYKVFLLAGSLLYLVFAGQPVYSDYGTGLSAYNHYDYQTARNEFRLAALDGHPKAQYYLGEIYEGGIGIRMDYRQAFHWYLQAAKQEHAGAQARLALLYMKGSGVDQSLEDSFYWYLRSAENGYPLAQFETGLLYAKGRGVPVDKIQAFKWLSIAASYGDPEAMAARQELVKGISPADRVSATLMAREWESRREKRANN